MQSKARFRLTVVTLLTVASTVACANVGVAATATPVPTVDTDAIVQQVLAQLQSQLPQQTPMVEMVSTSTQSQTDVAADLEASLENVYVEANPSVVSIETSADATGSGFVYSADGYIVTNN